MSRSFFSRRSSSTKEDDGPLLPLDSNTQVSISLQNLSPRPSRSRSPASPSPPPSFYRSKNPNSNTNSQTYSPSTSPSVKGRNRVIQFSAPPPPIATSVLLGRGPRAEQYAAGRSPRSTKSNELETGGRNSSPALPHQRRSSGAGVLDPLIGLERRERAIQRELQELLDAQSAGLIHGVGAGGGSVDGGSEAGSSTPTHNSATRSRSMGKSGAGGGFVPVRQPKRKVVSLRGARRGLLADIAELAAVKSEEVGILDIEIAQREHVLQRVAAWEERIESFRSQLASSAESPQGGEEGREIAELKNEERAVENEIREMEDRLAQMRARKKWLGERINEGVNRREARLSSYRGALREVESEVKEFLRRPPVLAGFGSGVDVGHDGFMGLPAGRRTLGMAKEWWGKELEKLEARKGNVEEEKEALQKGAKIWEESVQIVVEFEDDLRKQMASNQAQDANVLKNQVGKMERVIERLSENARVAEEKGWNLLICAIGAELEAFKEGEGILKGALGMVGGQNEQMQNQDSIDDTDDRGNGLKELNGEQSRIDSIEREDSEDDGPNLADLLVDQGHAYRDVESSLD